MERDIQQEKGVRERDGGRHTERDGGRQKIMEGDGRNVMEEDIIEMERYRQKEM